MAKRKRLTPANPAFLEPAPETGSALSPLRAAPIAEVARAASASAAAEEMADALTRARADGRMVLAVPLEAVQRDYITRDRIAVQEDEMQALKTSLRARGQQVPVDLVDLGDGRYGLISGWRRCLALQALFEETGEARFAEVLALLRRPADAAEAYHAMVEENEIRAGLSHYERARIVCKAVEQGVFETDRAALQGLFGSASRPRRSKIGSFLAVVRALEGSLRFPEAIGERLGLALSRGLGEDPALAARIEAALRKAAPETAAAELSVLQKALAPVARPATDPAAPLDPAGTKTVSDPAQSDPGPDGMPVVGGVTLHSEDQRITLEGYRVNAVMKTRLITWLRQNF